MRPDITSRGVTDFKLCWVPGEPADRGVTCALGNGHARFQPANARKRRELKRLAAVGGSVLFRVIERRRFPADERCSTCH